MGLFDGDGVGGLVQDTVGGIKKVSQGDIGALPTGLLGPYGAMAQIAGVKDLNQVAELTGLKPENVQGPNIPGLPSDLNQSISERSNRSAGDIQSGLSRGIQSNLPGTNFNLQNAQLGGQQFASSDALNRKAQEAFSKDLSKLNQTAEFQALNQKAQQVTEGVNYRNNIRNIQRGVDSQIAQLNMQQEAARNQVIGQFIGAAGYGAGYGIGHMNLGGGSNLGKGAATGDNINASRFGQAGSNYAVS